MNTSYGNPQGALAWSGIAIERVMQAIADDKKRILLTLATGTGKTFIAFQIAWKLFHARWNLSREATRRPRILFLADRNILANQAFNAFSAFPEDALVRIAPDDIKKKGKVPKNGSLFFTIFQTFMSGPENTPYFGDYPKDFFDFIVIDECHRGGANDESNWRGIMDYFSPAVQLGLTATPKRDENVDNGGLYRYYRCTRKAGACSEPYTQEKVVIDQCLEAIQPLAISPEQANFVRALIDKETQKDSQSLETASVEMTDKISLVQKKLNKLTQGYLDEMIDEESYQANKTGSSRKTKRSTTEKTVRTRHLENPLREHYDRRLFHPEYNFQTISVPL